jgi:glycosyltransferase involved in cell wall biosynthesis
MIHVLHLISSFGLGGGSEPNLLRVVRRMDKLRFRNTIVTMTEGVGYEGLRSELERDNIRVYSLAMRRGVANPLRAARLLKIVKNTRPNILQTWMYHADLLGTLVGRLARVPIIAWNIQCSSLSAFDHRWTSAALLRTLRALSRVPDIVLANSQIGIEFHRTIGYRPRRWLYIPNSLDLREFRPDSAAAGWLRTELNLPCDALLIGYVARFHPIKDHGTFVAAAQLLACDPRIHFVLVGRDVNKENPFLAKPIAATGSAGRFHLLDHRTDVNRITAGLDIACSSSLSEGSSNVIAEAMACGTPCVATDVGDAALILQDAGMVVPPKQPKAIADRCRAILSLDVSRRHELGSMARARVEEFFSPQKVVTNYENTYEELWASVCRSRNSYLHSPVERDCI